VNRWGRGRLIGLILVLLTVVLAACGGDVQDPAEGEPAALPVERGTLVSAVTAIGSVTPHQQVSHAFGVGGRVAEVLVAVGDRVEIGETLGQLDPAELTLQLQAAEAARDVAQAQLDRLRSGARPEEVVAARANIDAAQARLAAAEEDLRELEDDEQATDAQLRAAETNVAVLTAQRDAAQAQRDLLTAGPTSAELAAAEAQLAQAEATLAGSQLALDETELTSALAGVVAQVDIAAGQLVAPQAPVIVVVDDSRYHVELDVDETDIGGVRVGQEVALTLDAFVDQQLSGRVLTVAPTPTLDLGIVTYQVTVEIDPVDLPLRAGLTANAEIVRERRDDVLLVPNMAIVVDRTTGAKTVTRRSAVGDEQITIETGLSTDLYSEVLAGLVAGDLVVVDTVSYRDQLQQVMGAYLQGGDSD
jgi:HlyD family secretion protein